MKIQNIETSDHTKSLDKFHQLVLCQGTLTLLDVSPEPLRWLEVSLGPA